MRESDHEYVALLSPSSSKSTNIWKCLLPLANTPLIEYTLEFLAKAGVQDIFVYCGAHTEQVEEYLRSAEIMTWDKTSDEPN